MRRPTSTYVVMRTTSRPRRRATGIAPIAGVRWWSGQPITRALPPLVQPLSPYAPWSGDEAAYLGPVLNTNPPVWRDDLIAALQAAGVDNLQPFEITVESPPNTAQLAAVRQSLAESISGDVDAYLHSIGHRDVQTWADPSPRAFHDYKAVNVINTERPDARLSRIVGSSSLLVHASVQAALLSAGFGDDLTFDDPADLAL